MEKCFIVTRCELGKDSVAVAVFKKEDDAKNYVKHRDANTPDNVFYYFQPYEIW